MGNPVWGALEKSQIDDETVEEAIDRLIESHNNDPDSHVEEGQSLASHKAADIIDHRVGSVVADKFSHQDSFHLCSFESLDNWTTTGVVTLDGWPGVQLYVGFTDDVASLRSVIKSGAGGWLVYNRMLVFQFTMRVDGDEEAELVAFVGLWNATDDFDGFGFYYKDDEIKGCFGDGTNHQFTSVFTVTLSEVNVFRAQFDPNTDTVTFYINGVVVGSLIDATPGGSIDAEIQFFADAFEVEVDNFFQILNVLISKAQV